MTSTKVETVSASALALVPGVVVLLAILVLSAIGDVLVATMPFAFDEAQWRFRAFGSVLAQAPQLTLIVLVFLLAGVVGIYRPALRIGALLGMVLAVLFVILVPFFALDFLQLRRMVAVAARDRYDLAAMKTAAMAAVFAPFLFWMGWRAWVAARNPKDSARREKGDGLVVGQGG